jgi:hypothetical protein
MAEEILFSAPLDRKAGLAKILQYYLRGNYEKFEARIATLARGLKQRRMDDIISQAKSHFDSLFPDLPHLTVEEMEAIPAYQGHLCILLACFETMQEKAGEKYWEHFVAQIQKAQEKMLEVESIKAGQ